MHRPGQPKWLVWLSAGALLCGALQIAASLRFKQSAEAVPRMTCDDLIRLGPGAGQFVTLTDVRLCSGGYAFQRDRDAAMEMEIPIYSARLKREPHPASLKLLLQVLDDRAREALLERPDVGELTVEQWTLGGQLDRWVEARLAAL